MMQPDERDHLLLAVYLDGELSPVETLEMEQRILAEPALRALRDSLENLSGSVREVFSETPIPPGYADRIGEQFAKVKTLPRRPERPAWRAIAAALLVGLIIGGPIGYALPGLSTRPQTDPVQEALFASHLRGLAASQPFDIASSDRHTVKPWFNGRTSIAPDAPDLSAQGFLLVGGRVDIVDGEPVPTVVYRRRQHVISLTAVARNDNGSPGLARREGTQIERWDTGDLSYFAISDLNPKELGEFGAMFRSATAPTGQ